MKRMEEVLSLYYEKYSIPSEGRKELIEIFNKSLMEISEGILKTRKDKKKEIVKEKKYASKKAEDYAIENDLSLSDFEKEKISKKDVDEKIKERTKLKLSPNRQIENKSPKKKETKVICSGLTKKGEPCTRAGTHHPDGSKKHYCFRHSEDWKAFECDSDSSNDSDDESDNEKESDKNQNCNEIQNSNEIQDE